MTSIKQDDLIGAYKDDNAKKKDLENGYIPPTINIFYETGSNEAITKCVLLTLRN